MELIGHIEECFCLVSYYFENTSYQFVPDVSSPPLVEEGIKGEMLENIHISFPHVLNKRQVSGS